MEKQFLIDIFAKALVKLNVNAVDKLVFETPKNLEHGDISCNIAMQLAKELRKAPRLIATELVDKMEYNKNEISKIEIAGAGFINIKFANTFYPNLFNSIREQSDNFGRQTDGEGKKINVEYVSANPTGLLHLGHGRNAAIGDTISNLYEWMGYEVTREYYFNNAGNQMNNLAKSIYARYMQELGEEYDLPENAYHGEYIITIAKEIIEKHGDNYKEGTYQDITELKKYGENWNFEKIKETLEKMNVHQDVYYNENTLYTSGKIKKLLEELSTKNLSYEKDGAVWMKFSELGQDADRVIVKATGEPTYRLPDIAYHIEKFKRGYDKIIDIFGSDHIAAIPDVIAAIEALGYDKEKIEVLIYQFVTLMQDGEQVKMSKRSGKSYTLDELIDEVGADVVRFFLIMRSSGTHLEFDLGLAQEQSDKNPVFYLQYAHARICSIFENADNQGISLDSNFDHSLLIDENEIRLIKQILKLPVIIKNSYDKNESHPIAEYLRETASAFHSFYHNCKILGVETGLMQARLNLAYMTKVVLKNGLDIMGITCPEKM